MTEFGRRHEVLVPRLPWPRLAGAALILGTAVAGAAILHSHKLTALNCDPQHTITCSWPDTRAFTPWWVSPTLLALCSLGVVGAIGVLTAKRRLVTAAAALGIALGAAAVVYADSYRGGIIWCSGRACSVLHGRYTWASWGSGTALGIALLGVLLAAGVLLTARRGRPD